VSSSVLVLHLHLLLLSTILLQFFVFLSLFIFSFSLSPPFFSSHIPFISFNFRSTHFTRSGVSKHYSLLLTTLNPRLFRRIFLLQYVIFSLIFVTRDLSYLYPLSCSDVSHFFACFFLFPLKVSVSVLVQGSSSSSFTHSAKVKMECKTGPLPEVYVETRGDKKCALLLSALLQVTGIVTPEQR
jgi:hypothetical protein